MKHSCRDQNQLVFGCTIQDRIRALIVAGCGCYKSSERAIWYNSNIGRRIPFETAVEAQKI